MALNDKQEKFAQAYCLNRNATDAARSAGYSKESAYNQGYRLLQTEEVQEILAELEKDLNYLTNTLNQTNSTIDKVKKQETDASLLEMLEVK